MRVMRAVDLFCGGGGTSQGAEDSGAAKVVFAVNHWDVAIRTHAANFPECRHVCARVDQVSPGEVDRLDLLFASPECTHHSRARGGRPMQDQKRAMAWDVLKWIDFHRPSWVIVENVVEFEEWGPLGDDGRPLESKRGHSFHAWVKSIESFNYRVEWRRLNAADFGAATSRVRLFVIARKGNRSIPWPEPTHTERPNGQFPGMRLQRWRSAAEIIDWTKPAPSIFARKRALADKTLMRIEAGLRRFCTAENVQAFIVKLRGTSHSSSADQPLPTITAGGMHEAVAVPMVMSNCGGGVARSAGDPIPTLTARSGTHLIVPFMLDRNNPYGDEVRAKGVDDPLRTITASGGGPYLCAPFIVPCRSATRCRRRTRGPSVWRLRGETET